MYFWIRDGAIARNSDGSIAICESCPTCGIEFCECDSFPATIFAEVWTHPLITNPTIRTDQCEHCQTLINSGNQFQLEIESVSHDMGGGTCPVGWMTRVDWSHEFGDIPCDLPGIGRKGPYTKLSVWLKCCFNVSANETRYFMEGTLDSDNSGLICRWPTIVGGANSFPFTSGITLGFSNTTPANGPGGELYLDCDRVRLSAQAPAPAVTGQNSGNTPCPIDVNSFTFDGFESSHLYISG